MLSKRACCLDRLGATPGYHDIAKLVRKALIDST